jgi:hypothetical protein
MAPHTRWLVLAVGGLVVCQPMAAQAGTAGETLLVRVYDASGLSTRDLMTARETTHDVMKQAGIALAWRECPCDAPLQAGERIVRIIGAPSTSEPEALGFSYVDARVRAGTLATVFADRIGALAASTRVESGQLLGRAIAHELGHLLLGTVQHPDHGLMRARWSIAELQQRKPWDWLMATDDARQMRRALARASRPQQPEALVAGGPRKDETGGE